jgi:hypothetical protein
LGTRAETEEPFGGGARLRRHLKGGKALRERVKERRKLGGATPELTSLTNGTGGLITHVGSDPAHQEQHCLRSGWAILQCRRARRQRDPLSCLQSANSQA